MAVSHMYVFSDACPSDWLTAGDDEWHTIVNFVFQSDPAPCGSLQTIRCSCCC